MKIPFNWLYWFILLVITAVAGCFSGVNTDGIPNFGASVAHGLAHGDVLLILSAVGTLLLVLWLLLALLSSELSARHSAADQDRT